MDSAFKAKLYNLTFCVVLFLGGGQAGCEILRENFSRAESHGVETATDLFCFYLKKKLTYSNLAPSFFLKIVLALAII